MRALERLEYENERCVSAASCRLALASWSSFRRRADQPLMARRALRLKSTVAKLEARIEAVERAAARNASYDAGDRSSSRTSPVRPACPPTPFSMLPQDLVLSSSPPQEG